MKKYLVYFSLFVLSFGTFIGCEVEDEDDGDGYDYGIPTEMLNLTECEATYIFPNTDRREQNLLKSAEIPQSIRAYIAAEFAGYTVMETTQFTTREGVSFIEVGISGVGHLLFDSNNEFLCIAP